MEAWAAVAKTLSDLLPVVLHTFVIYVFLVTALSLLGRREISNLTVMELVIITVIGSAVETSLIAGNTSLVAGLVSAATLLVSNRLFSLLLRHSLRLRRVLMGHPIPLVYKGQFLPAGLREAGLTEDDVKEGVRERGYEKVEQVRLAVLEIDGLVSVVPEEEQSGGQKPSA